jgi:hypothetical protein
MERTHEITIRSLHVAAALVLKGEKLLRIVPSANPRFSDFVFVKSPTIFRCQDAYRTSELYTFYRKMQDLKSGEITNEQQTHQAKQ